MKSRIALVVPITRTFSTPGRSPYDEIEWERRDVAITDDSGAVIFRQEGIECPRSWSSLATKIAVSKYFYGDITKGTDPAVGGRETSIRQLIDRVVDTIVYWAVEDGYLADTVAAHEADDSPAEIFRYELTWLLVNQHAAFNSPVWFNLGLYPKYGVGKGGSAGNWVFDDIAFGAMDEKRNDHLVARRAATQYEHPQSAACFIQSVDDSMEGIMALATAEAMLFKYGSGTGTDLSTLRSTREKLSGGGKPSGPLSFLKVYDAVAGVIKSGGKEAVQ
jgi:ribonucleoside-diphosphate reductase alpha chain